VSGVEEVGSWGGDDDDVGGSVVGGALGFLRMPFGFGFVWAVGSVLIAEVSAIAVWCSFWCSTACGVVCEDARVSISDRFHGQ
jgi:amino acid permease